MQGVYSWQWHHCKKMFRWFRSVTHNSNFVTILICTTTTNPTTTKKEAELGKNPTQHSLTPFGQSWVVLARSQKTIRNLQVFFCMQTRSSEALVLKNCVCAESCRSAVVFFFENHQVVFTWACSGPHINIKESGDGGGKHSLILASSVITHSCEGFHSLSAYCFIFQGTSGSPEIYPMSIYVENMRCANVMTPFFPAQPGTV